MDFEFFELYPDFIANTPVLVSGKESDRLGQTAYLFGEDEQRTLIFEIRYEYHCSPFQKAELIGPVLAIGHEEHFYLFDTVTSATILRLKMDGYFGSFVVDDGIAYVADASSIYCINMDGEIKYRTQTLGIDGVIIHDIENNKITGSGEWDPPGGWIDFVLDKITGAMLNH